MGKTFETLVPALREWIAKQPVFFVATAPLADDGHVNCSPKGSDSFRILNEREVAYLDLTGSGVETIAHVQENERIVIMFCAFEGPPKIVRIHGRGDIILPTDPEFAQLSPLFPSHAGARAIIRVKATRISDSCGFTVPFMDYVKHRETLDRWTDKKSPEELADYRKLKNETSIDGIPGYPSPS
ncbi:MAG: pyridoxamine 5'-phosphate oxidase family protein [Opitutaceae bacterium]|jgi:hypothetical protein|nr:pyridoxamine 5'-phosphate oxidase family protein [Opitutaceae bacterium]